MPLLTSLSLALSLAIAGVQAQASCPSDTPFSCSSSSGGGSDRLSRRADDSCCVNTPGGMLLQTQFWDTDPSTGPSDSWTIHGLWYVICT